MSCRYAGPESRSEPLDLVLDSSVHVDAVPVDERSRPGKHAYADLFKRFGNIFRIGLLYDGPYVRHDAAGVNGRGITDEQAQ
ncbi:MAG: hypothetical protein V1792_28635 [Pseudomonadota bacterium]